MTKIEIEDLVAYSTGKVIGEIPKLEFVVTGKEEAFRREVKFETGKHVIAEVLKSFYKKEELEQINKTLEMSFDAFKGHRYGHDQNIDEEAAKAEFLEPYALATEPILKDFVFEVIDSDMEEVLAGGQRGIYKSNTNRNCVIALVVFLLLVLVAGFVVVLSGAAGINADQYGSIVALLIFGALGIVISICGGAVIYHENKKANWKVRKELLSKVPAEVLQRYSYKDITSMNEGITAFEELINKNQDKKGKLEVVLSKVATDKTENLRQFILSIKDSSLAGDVLRIVTDYLFEPESASAARKAGTAALKDAPANETKYDDDDDQSSSASQGETGNKTTHGIYQALQIHVDSHQIEEDPDDESSSGRTGLIQGYERVNTVDTIRLDIHEDSE